MQCAAFLSAVLEGGLARRALVVAPKTLLSHWSRELAVCGLAERSHQFLARADPGGLHCVVQGGGVLLTTYGVITHNPAAFATQPSHDPDEGPMWDVVILDEARRRAPVGRGMRCAQGAWGTACTRPRSPCRGGRRAAPGEREWHVAGRPFSCRDTGSKTPA